MIFELNPNAADELLKQAAGFSKPCMTIKIVTALSTIFYKKGKADFIMNARFIGWSDSWIAALLYQLTISAESMRSNVTEKIEL